MKRVFVSFTILSMLILLLMKGLCSIGWVSAESKIWIVDDDGSGDFSTISEAIHNATPGDSILVRSGTYFEHLNVSIPITLVGEDPFTTIIDGGGQRLLPIILINSTDAIIKNFTIQNTASDFLVGGFGILVSETENVTVENNIFSRTYYGIQLRNVSDCRILNNKLQRSYDSAIVLIQGSVNNTIIQNSLEDNPIGIWIADSTSNLNVFYRNNFLNNINHANIFGGPNTWDNGVEGNFWDNYQGTDSDGDGVGDTAHLGVDNYPLIEPWSSTRTYEVLSHEIIVRCNYTVASFNLNQSLKTISFYITGPSSSEGYCTVTVPVALLNPGVDERWSVMFGSNQPTFTNESVDDSNLVSFNFTLGSSMPENLASIKVGARTRISTTITLDSPESVSQNIAFTLAATLIDEIEDPVNDASIQFTLKNESEWKLIGYVVTDHDGVASINYTAQSTGEFFLKADFIGDARYGASSSGECSLTVVAPASNFSLYIIVVIIVTLGAGLLILALKRARKSS